MKKYILLVVVSSCFCISHACAQSQASTKREQTAVVNTDSASSTANTAHGTISRAGKNQQSVYTPPANAGSNAPASGNPAPQQSSPAKTEQAVIDPKK